MAIIMRVQRPSGEIEEVNLTKAHGIHGMTDKLYAHIAKCTAQDGRGTVLDWRHEDGRSEAQKAYDEVANLEALMEQAADRPAEYFKRQRAYRDAEAAWIAKYPDAHKARVEAAAKAKADRQAALDNKDILGM